MGGNAESGRRAKLKAVLRQLGPGIVARAADDDPSGIATYSQAGARFGFGMLWPVLFTLPLRVNVQLIAGAVARLTDGFVASAARV